VAVLHFTWFLSHVTNSSYSSTGGGRITQMSDFCCILQSYKGGASGIIGLFTRVRGRRILTVVRQRTYADNAKMDGKAP